MKTVRSLTIALIFYTNIHSCIGGPYSNYCIYNIYPYNDEHRNVLVNMDKNINLDLIFTEMPLENDIVQVLVNNKMESEFIDRIQSFQIKIRKIANNAQQVFDNQLFQGSPTQQRSKYETFQTLSNIYKWLNETARQYPYANLETIGKTSEGRDILAFSIKIPPRPNYNNLKAIIESGIHGNEWLSTASSLYMIEQLLNASDGPYEILKKKYFLYFIPVVNPDGYEYSQTKDPLWKKNRRRTGNDTFGVNLNRNFAYKFGEFDSSDDKHSQYYRGPYPFSEYESASIEDFVYRKRNQIAFYFSIHGHGQKFILPYSDSLKHVVNYHEVQNFARKVINKLSVSSDSASPYRVGLAHEVLGKRYSGDSASWVKKTYHVPFTMTIQLRDYNDLGVALPISEIEPAGRDLTESLTSFMLSTGRYSSYENDAARIEVKLLLLLIALFFVY